MEYMKVSVVDKDGHVYSFMGIEGMDDDDTFITLAHGDSLALFNKDTVARIVVTKQTESNVVAFPS